MTSASRMAAGSATEEFTSASPPGTSRPSAKALCLWCITTTDLVLGRIGSTRRPSSSTTTLACDGPPRISPPTSDVSIACSPPRVAASASVLAMSWIP